MVSKWYDVMGKRLLYLGPKLSAYIIEFIGTFFLVGTIGFNVVGKNPNAPIAIGSMLMVMIFMGGHISGAHFNPAITLGVRLTGRDHISTLNAFIYLVCQILAGIVASFFVWGITGGKKYIDPLILQETFAPMPGDGVDVVRALLVEFVYTFALVSVMLNCATTKSQNANSFFGLAIGFTVLSAAYSVGGLSGGAFNPAVATGPTIINGFFGHQTFQYIWIYWVGPLLGAVLAAIVFRVTNSAEYRRNAVIAGTANNKTEYRNVQDQPPAQLLFDEVQ